MAYEFIRLYEGKDGVVDSFGLNIAFSDTPPTDTNKLWVKTSTPSDISINLVSDEYIEIPASMPAATPSCESVIAVGNKIYLFGPYGYGATSGTKSIRYYNIETGTIHTLGAKLSNAISADDRASIGVYNNKIYIIGGTEKSEYDRILHILDIEKGTMETVTVSRPAYSYSACAVIGNRLYMLGGQGSNMNTTYARIGYIDLETMDFVVSEATLDTSKSCMGCTVYDGKIYVFGGGYSNGASNSVLAYDPETDNVTNVGTLPTKLHSAISGRIGNKMYFLWGYTRNNEGSNTVQNRMFYYDLETQTNNVITSKMSYPSGEWYSGFTTVNDTIYVFGRKIATETTYEAKQYKFMAKPEANEGSLVIETTEYSAFIKLIDDDLIKASINAYRAFAGNSQGIGDLVEAAVYKDGEWVNI